MRTVLHILTKPGDDLAAQATADLRQGGNRESQVVDLTAEDPDYEALLDAIFEADAIVVW